MIKLFAILTLLKRHDYLKKEENKMGFKLNIVTIDDGEIEEILGSANDALDYLCDKVDPELVSQMKLTTPSGHEVSGYCAICEWLVKSERVKA